MHAQGTSIDQYVPLDISAQVNRSDSFDAQGAHEWRDRVLLRGIPFDFASRDGRSQVLAIEAGAAADIVVPGEVARFRSLIVAHRSERPEGPGLADVGVHAGTYEIHYADGHVEAVAVRDGFEIAAPPSGERHDWGVRPSLAVPDQNDSLPDRCHGSFSAIGERLTEVVEAGQWSDRWGEGELRRGGWRFYLYPWLNPMPERDVVRIRLVGGELTIVVGAITVGLLDEHPLRPEPARPVVATVPDSHTHRIDELTLEVDRGTASYTRPLWRPSDGTDPLGAWGDRPGAKATEVTANISATPSGSVRLMDGEECLAEASWAEMRGDAGGRDGRLRIAERGKNWVRTRVVDAETGKALPSRVHFSSPEGLPYQPHGHHNYVKSGLEIPTSWAAGADVRLGKTSYAYIDGECEGWLPHGPVHVQVSRGFEYTPLNEVVTIEPGQQELTLRVKRFRDLTQQGWYSGDTHVHFVSSFGGLREAAAEGVSVVHLLLAQWGSRFTNAEDFLGRPLVSDDGSTILYASQENRQHFLGHVGLLGLKKPVMPWSTDGAAESDIGSGLEATLSDWVDRCREQGGLPIVAHFPAPNGELATLIATQRVGAVEILESQERCTREYYRYLNAGFRLPLAGATDKMSTDVPIGLNRTYVQLHEDADFGFDAWCEALALGRSYQSSGPLLDFSVDGRRIGDTVHLPASGGTVEISARAECIFPMYRLELVHRGRVIATSESDAGSFGLQLSHRLQVDDAGWLCIRVVGGGPNDLTHHRDEWGRAIMAHTSPIYLACGSHDTMADVDALEYTATLVERGRTYAADLAPKATDDWVTHHHGGDHDEHLLKPFFQAQAELDRRIADARARRRG